MTGMAWLGGGVRRVRLGLILTASLGAAVGMLVGGPAFALGETGGSPTETGKSPTGRIVSYVRSGSPEARAARASSGRKARSAATPGSAFSPR